MLERARIKRSYLTSGWNCVFISDGKPHLDHWLDLWKQIQFAPSMKPSSITYKICLYIPSSVFILYMEPAQKFIDVDYQVTSLQNTRNDALLEQVLIIVFCKVKFQTNPILVWTQWKIPLSKILPDMYSGIYSFCATARKQVGANHTDLFSFSFNSHRLML